jgi:hypothetical protein
VIFTDSPAHFDAPDTAWQQVSVGFQLDARIPVCLNDHPISVTM